jgi:hypothetical protein
LVFGVGSQVPNELTFEPSDVRHHRRWSPTTSQVGYHALAECTESQSTRVRHHAETRRLVGDAY